MMNLRNKPYSLAWVKESQCPENIGKVVEVKEFIGNTKHILTGDAWRIYSRSGLALIDPETGNKITKHDAYASDKVLEPINGMSPERVRAYDMDMELREKLKRDGPEQYTGEGDGVFFFPHFDGEY